MQSNAAEEKEEAGKDDYNADSRSYMLNMR